MKHALKQQASPLDVIEQKLVTEYVPAWFEMFYDEQTQSFHERLNAKTLTPLDVGFKRALSQFRQIYIYADCCSYNKALEAEIGEKLLAAITTTIDRYFVDETGGWIFKVKLDGTSNETHYDLYAQAFAIFAMAACYKWKQDKRYLDIAEKTFDLVNTQFRQNHETGFCEALDETLKPMPLVRRQNPHMHLCESCLFMYEASGQKKYLEMATEMIHLLQTQFINLENHTLCEFFEDDLNAHQDQGWAYEAGHHFEWVALLERYLQEDKSKTEEVRYTISNLLDWADKYGFDREYGGIYNSCNQNGVAIDSNKRIWPVAEALKAYAVMLRRRVRGFYAENKMKMLLTLLEDKYLRGAGQWNEILDQKLNPTSDFLPATTPYHIYLGIIEAQKIVRSYKE